MRRIGVVAGSGAGVATRRLIGTTPTDFGSKPVSTSGVRKPPLADPTGGAGLIGKMFADPEPPAAPAAVDAQPSFRARLRAEQQVAVERARTPFTSKIEQLASQADIHKARREKWRAKKSEARLNERKQKLVYRYVGDDLDRFSWRRDFIHWAKYIRFGSEFIVDEALERMCRFFNRDAQLELRQSPKLFRGLPKLSNAGMKFPSLRVSKATNFVRVIGPNGPADSSAAAAAALRKKLAEAKAAAAASATGKAEEEVELAGAPATAAPIDAKTAPSEAQPDIQRDFTGVKYDTADDKKVVLSANSFRKPTMVIYANVGGYIIGEGKEADVKMWKDLVRDPANFKTSNMIDVVSGRPAVPGAAGAPAQTAGARKSASSAAASKTDVLDQGPAVDEVVSNRTLGSRNAHPQQQQQQQQPQTPAAPAAAAVNLNQKISPVMAKYLGQSIEVITVRTIDTYVSRAIRHISSMRIRDFVTRMPLEELDRTYIGTDLTRALETLGLQNHLSVYCFLVDHKGRIRWMSAGQPDQFEVDVFPELLQQLDYEFLKANSNRQ